MRASAWALTPHYRDPSIGRQRRRDLLYSIPPPLCTWPTGLSSPSAIVLSIQQDLGRCIHSGLSSSRFLPGNCPTSLAQPGLLLYHRVLRPNLISVTASTEPALYMNLLHGLICGTCRGDSDRPLWRINGRTVELLGNSYADTCSEGERQIVYQPTVRHGSHTTDKPTTTESRPERCDQPPASGHCQWRSIRTNHLVLCPELRPTRRRQFQSLFPGRPWQLQLRLAQPTGPLESGLEA